MFSEAGRHEGNLRGFDARDLVAVHGLLLVRVAAIGVHFHGVSVQVHDRADDMRAVGLGDGGGDELLVDFLARIDDHIEHGAWRVAAACAADVGPVMPPPVPKRWQA